MKPKKIPKVILLITAGYGFGRGLLLGIAKYARYYGPWAIHNILEGGHKSLFSKGKLEADGIIAHFNELKNVKKFIPDGIPAVLCGKITAKFPNHPHFITDNAKAGKMAAEHLLERGFRNFAFCSFDDMLWSQQRAKSFSKRIAEAGFKTPFLRELTNASLSILGERAACFG